jgi:hypothetical protein
MCGTFHPLKLTKFAKELDDGRYWHSWYENAQDDAGPGLGGRRRERRRPHVSPVARRSAVFCS